MRKLVVGLPLSGSVNRLFLLFSLSLCPCMRRHRRVVEGRGGEVVNRSRGLEGFVVYSVVRLVYLHTACCSTESMCMRHLERFFLVPGLHYYLLDYPTVSYFGTRIHSSAFLWLHWWLGDAKDGWWGFADDNVLQARGGFIRNGARVQSQDASQDCVSIVCGVLGGKFLASLVRYRIP